ncbi:MULTISPECIES: hypothetical protein [Rhizobium]|uniref:hypothetical protein n=1 Tax=Rhizobium TaxID=379 RepID=UPI0013D9E84C|nr:MULTISPECIES: hypothetical protein [Rhizobium]MBY3139006.1 hypothetical protein [Rhizobium laguerreae]NEH97014.1 hypothetical protein [Rhizobium leguminosarum]NKM65137.1 hypothetical protein [Rhizobium leguminosarum bv. viciae]
MRDDEDTPSMSRGLLRVGTLCLVVVLIAILFWDMFSESAALRRLAATAKNYRYAEKCDADGNVIATGQPNCVDLNHYVFVYGPVSRALRRACSGKSAAMLSFEPGKVARSEINLVEKMLQFRVRNGVNSPCGPDNLGK